MNDAHFGEKLTLFAYIGIIYSYLCSCASNNGLTDEPERMLIMLLRYDC